MNDQTTETVPVAGQAKPHSNNFNWDHCVSLLLPEDARELCERRGYSPEFVQWLRERGLIGIVVLGDNEYIAFPIHDGTAVVGAHVWNPEGNLRFFVHPKGTRMTPLVINGSADPLVVLAFESQWDALAAMDCLRWYEEAPPYRVIITRGASNGRQVAGHVPAGSTVFAFTQNDEAGQKWFQDITASVPNDVRNVITPAPFKDANDWLRTAVEPEELNRVMFHDSKAAPVVRAPATPVSISTPSPVPPPPDDFDFDPGPFPLDALHPFQRAMAESVARTYQVSPELPAMSAIAVLAGAIGKSCHVLDAVPERKTCSNIYCVAGAPKSYGKGLAVRIAKPLIDASHQRAKQFRSVERPALKARLEAARARVEAILKQIARQPKPGPPNTALPIPAPNPELAQLQAEIDELDLIVRHEPTYWIASSTMEALAQTLKRNDDTILSFSPEAGDLVRIALGKYRDGGKGDFDLLLSGFSNEPYRETRITRGDHVIIPCITTLWLVQPCLLHELLGHSEALERGLTARCLCFVCQHDEIPHDDGTQREIPPAAETAWATLVHKALDLRQAEPIAIPCHDEAREVFRAWHNGTVILRNGALRDLEGELGRAREHAIRLALGQCVADALASGHSPIQLTAHHAERGVALARWALFSTISIMAGARLTQRQARAERLVSLVAESGGSVPIRTLTKCHGFTKLEIQSLVARLSGTLAIQTVKGTTGRPSERVALVNPNA